MGDSYLQHKAEILEAFRGAVEAAKLFWAPEFGSARAEAMAREALTRYEGLVGGFPDVGGERNWCARFIPMVAWSVAFYGPMRENGKTAEDVGRLVYELNRVRLEHAPQEKLIEEGERMFTREAVDEKRDWTEWTQKREYPHNWVARFVWGDGDEFDWGYDYSQCGALEYLKSQGVPELAPYFCLCDFPNSAALRSGLQRSKTLAQGDELCDFRYKKGRPVLQDWSSEIALIRFRARK